MRFLITALVVTVLSVGTVALAYYLCEAIVAELDARALQNAAPAPDTSPARVPARATFLCPSCRTHGVSRPGTTCAPCQHGPTTKGGSR
ncbi:hypothetical protein [Phycicoccus sp. 3266]|uniref:hypothetical protein n=1 Tax=Phycicoccus sp. 3266 TaxID=2817751 RepID=UPI0028551D87|nr:hypothetical protein [Phycicoccus sp. 3266]MDR6861934.1 hypothetical protein [Phycicoccus sp. 3266]